MSTQLPTTRFQMPVEVSEAVQGRPKDTVWFSRLIQIALALYLIPALLVVLVAGGIGMVILAAARLLTAVLGGSAGGPRPPSGPSSLSSKT
jgi:hypothetical protein